MTQRRPERPEMVERSPEASGLGSALDVVIPVHNGGQLLKNAVDSVLLQNTARVSCFVFDNASDDGCADFLSESPYEQVEVTRSGELLSMGESWTRASRMGTAPRLILLPADDVLLPGSLARFIDAAGALAALNPPVTFAALHSRLKLLTAPRSRPIADLIMNWLEGRNSSVLGRASLEDYGPGLIGYHAVGRDFLGLVVARGGNFIGSPSCVMLDRGVLARCLPWSDRNPYVIDLDMWWRMAQHDRFVSTNWTGAAFRLHPGQATHQMGRRQAKDIVTWLREASAASESPDPGRIAFALLRFRVTAHALGRRLAHAVLSR